MMKKIIIVAGMLLALCTNAYADNKNVKQVGVYLGATAGATWYDDDGAISGSFDDEDYALQAIAGYKFNKYVALDARYVDLGEYSDSFSKADITAWSGNIVGSYPFTNSGWEAFGQLGYGRLTGDTDCCGKDKRNTATAGLGIRWSLNRWLSFSGQVDTWRFRTNEVNGEKYTNYITALSAGIQYVFE